MFRSTSQGPITRLRMASTFLGRPVYAVSAYAFADLLIDTGPPQTARGARGVVPGERGAAGGPHSSP